MHLVRGEQPCSTASRRSQRAAASASPCVDPNALSPVVGWRIRNLIAGSSNLIDVAVTKQVCPLRV
jgi:hypothetical protein